MDLTIIISGGILIGCIISLSWFAGSDAPYVPTKMNLIRKVLILANVKKGKRFYELGSGDGRVVFVAAKLSADSYGVEQSWIRVLFSKYKAFKQQVNNAKFIHGNIFSKNYSDADIVYIYLLPKGVKRLEGKLQKELKKGAVVITQTYHFPTWKPYKKIENFNLYKKS